MPIERLERVMWRLRKNNPDNDKPSNAELRRAVIVECGYCMRTYSELRKALIDIGWIRAYNRKRIRLTNKDITG